MFICTSKKEATQGDPAAIYYSRVKRHQLGMIWLIDIQLAPGKFSERALLEHNPLFKRESNVSIFHNYIIAIDPSSIKISK